MNPVLLDLDGVLVNFMKGIFNAHKVDPTKIHYPPGEWDLAKVLGMDQRTFFGPCGFDFWRGLDWMHDGRGILAAVEDRFGRENVCLWTSPTMNPGCLEGKRQWVKENLPRHYEFNLILGARKDVAASKNTLLIDDSDSNVKKFAERGGHTILVPRHWNALSNQKETTLSYVQDRLANFIWE